MTTKILLIKERIFFKDPLFQNKLIMEKTGNSNKITQTNQTILQICRPMRIRTSNGDFGDPSDNHFTMGLLSCNCKTFLSLLPVYIFNKGMYYVFIV